MALGVGAQLGIQFALGAFLSYLGRRREEHPIRHQNLRTVSTPKTGRDWYAAQYALGECRVTGVEVYRGYENVHFSETVNLPGGIGRRIHTALALSRGKLEELVGVFVNGTYREYDSVSEENLADGGMIYGGENVYGGSTFPSVRIVANFEGNGEQGSSLREAAQRMSGNPPLPWTENHRGEDVSWVHVSFMQPPYGDNPKTGVELKRVWEDFPDLEFVVKGMHIPIPTSGVDPDNWPLQYTESSAAVRFWFMRFRMGANKNIFEAPTVVQAHINSVHQVDMANENSWLANRELIRCVYQLGNDINTPPALPPNNDYPAPAPWVEERLEPTETERYLWRAFSIFVLGSWRPWSYGSGAVPVRTYKGAQHAPQTLNSMLSANSYDPQVVTQAFGAPDAGEIYIGGPDADDILDVGDPDPGPTIINRNPGDLPGDIDPCDARDPLRMKLLQDSTFSRYGVSGVIYSDDEPSSIFRELDFAWAGTVSRHGGRLRFLPGMDYRVRGILNKNNAKLTSVSPAPKISERTNSVVASLVESKVDEYGARQVRPQVDQSLVNKWGLEIARDLGQAPLVQPSPAALELLCAKWVRASSYAKKYSFECVIGNSFEYLTIRRGDRFHADFPLYGLTYGARPNGTIGYPELRVESIALGVKPWRVLLDCVDHPSGVIYRDDLAFPLNRLDASEPGGFVGVPENVRADEISYGNPDGSHTVFLETRWNPEAVDRSQVRIRPIIPGGQGLSAYNSVDIQRSGITQVLLDTPNWGEIGSELYTTNSNFILIPNVLVGVVYEIQVRNVTSRGIVSDWSQSVFRLISGDVIPPSTPTGQIGIDIPGGFRITYDHPEEPDYEDTEIWILNSEDGNQFSDAILAARVKGTNYDHIFQIGELPAIPPLYYVFLRHRDRSRNVSGVSELTVTPGAHATGDRILYDYAFYIDNTGDRPASPVGTFPTGLWNRLPMEPTAANRYGWFSFRTAIDDGSLSLDWSDWRLPQPWAVFDDAVIDLGPVNFTVNADLDWRRKSQSGETQLLAGYTASNADWPIIEVRVRYRNIHTDLWPEWNPADHPWIIIERRTSEGTRYGVLARLDVSYGDRDSGGTPMPSLPPQTVYLTKTGAAPNKPAGSAYPPAGWEVNPDTDPPNSAGEIQWRLTRQGGSSYVNWNHASTVLEQHRRYVVPPDPTPGPDPMPGTIFRYERTENNVAPARPANNSPANEELFANAARRYVFLSTSTNNGATWSDYELWDSYTTAVYFTTTTGARPSVPGSGSLSGGSTSPPPEPSGWIGGSPTSTRTHLWRVTARGNGNRYSYDTLLLATVYGVDEFYISANTTPATPVEYSPPSGWSGSPTSVTSNARNQYSSTRSGYNGYSYFDDIGRTIRVPASVTWSDPAPTGVSFMDIPSLPTQSTFRATATITPPTSLPTAGPNSNGWSTSAGASRSFPYLWEATRQDDGTGSYTAWTLNSTPVGVWQTDLLWIELPSGSSTPGTPPNNQQTSSSYPQFGWNPPPVTRSSINNDIWVTGRQRVWPGLWPAWGVPSIDNSDDPGNPVLPPPPV